MLVVLSRTMLMTPTIQELLQYLHVNIATFILSTFRLMVNVITLSRVM